MAIGVIVLVVRGGRRERLWVGAGAVIVIAAVALTVMTLDGHGAASPAWIEFSIGPATGDSLNVNSTTFRGDGATLKAAIATAFDFPAVRVIGPDWLAQTRYALRAMVGLDDEPRFHALLQEELNRHLHLETHVEVRPFDAYVMRATGAASPKPATGDGTAIALGRGNARMRNASESAIAGAMQSMVGRPVIDETGLTGLYDLELEWQEGHLDALKAAFRDRTGFALVPAQLNLEALVVDEVRLGRDLLLLAQAARLIRSVPANLRHPVARALTVN